MAVNFKTDDLEKFNPDEQTVDEWLERLEVYLSLMNVTEQRDKISALLHFSGPRVYTVLRQACLPIKPAEKTFDELCNIFRANYESQPLSRSYRRKLAIRVQHPSESVTQFANALRVLVSKCDYPNAYLETVLVDTFTRNVRSAELKAKFDKAKADDITTLSKCLELARLFESFEEAKQSRATDVVCKTSSRARVPFVRGRGASQLYSRDGAQNRGGFSQRGSRGGYEPQQPRDPGGKRSQPSQQSRERAYGGSVRCYACGDEGHKSFNCRFKSYTCNMCHRQGHIKKACPVSRTKAVVDDELQQSDEIEDLSHLQDEVYISKNVLSHHVERERIREVSVGNSDRCWENVCADELDVEFEATKLSMCIQSEMQICEGHEGNISDITDFDCANFRGESDSCMHYDLVKLVEGMCEGKSGQSLMVKININGKDMAMEVDNGSRHSLITRTRFSAMFPGIVVRGTNVKIASLSGHSLCAAGEVPVVVHERGQKHRLRLIICDNQDDFFPLLGREWLDAIVPEWRSLLGFKQISEESQVKAVFNAENDNVSAELGQLKAKYPSVFNDDGSSLRERESNYRAKAESAGRELKLDEESQGILVLNTCIGLLKPTRLPYGLASASACFQSVIDQILQDLKCTRAYIDDIIVGGKDVEDCRHNLNAVLSRLEKHKVRVKFEKLKLYQSEVDILGYVLGYNFYKPSPRKVKAILNCATPRNPSEVHSYVGMLNFYSKFLPRASTLFKPLYDLLAKDAVWEWNDQCEEAFNLSKQMLVNSNALAVYDPSRELVLVCDASPVGIGAVLAQRDGKEERPIEFMSKMLTATQQRYSQLEREALGIIVSLQKFHKYLWGRKFSIVTDNMPLKSMFSPTKTTPKVSAQRLQRWSLILGNYHYELEYRKSSQMGAADMLSRLPVKEYACDESCNVVVDLPDLPVSFEAVVEETDNDPQGNGLAERFVETVKAGLGKELAKVDGNSLSIKLSNYLLALLTTPSTVTKKCPSEFMLAFEPKTLVNAIKPKLRKYVPSKREFRINDIVKVKLSKNHDVFLAKIVKIVGPTLVHVEMFDTCKIIKVSTNQIQLTSNVGFNHQEDDKFQFPLMVEPSQDAVPIVLPKQVIAPDVQVVSPINRPEQISVSVNNDVLTVSSPIAVTPPRRELRDRSQLRLPVKLRMSDFLLNK
ncbi:uncharacterized protein LOC124173288 [Ischnura elegans]|uniref:uncharacterized protein LOC124173288 n=1 Tax=Ischnura elegans TaxID=197161 RepID=UPI001ED87821|nr:uncharacterized protein LOC124173288 [Ischnura elegans]